MTEERLTERMRRLARNHPFRTLDPWAAALKDGADEIDHLRADNERLRIAGEQALAVLFADSEPDSWSRETQSLLRLALNPEPTS